MAAGPHTPTHFLIFNVETRDYRGVASNGKVVVVAEHIFEEQVRLLTHHLMAREGARYGDAAAYRRLHNDAINWLSNANAWNGEKT